MSYAVSASLQSAVYQALVADPTLQMLVGDYVFDALPSGVVPQIYVSLGPEEVRDASDKSHGGAVHVFTISVMSTTPGFRTGKTVAGVICDVLVDADLTLERGRLIALNFEKATATRTDAGNGRQIDLRFAARVEDS